MKISQQNARRKDNSNKVQYIPHSTAEKKKVCTLEVVASSQFFTMCPFLESQCGFFNPLKASLSALYIQIQVHPLYLWQKDNLRFVKRNFWSLKITSVPVFGITNSYKFSAVPIFFKVSGQIHVCFSAKWSKIHCSKILKLIKATPCFHRGATDVQEQRLPALQSMLPTFKCALDMSHWAWRKGGPTGVLGNQ